MANSPGDWLRASVWRVRALVIAGYGLLAVVFSWPLPLYMADRAVLARGADFYQHIWNLWWVKFSLLTLHQNPYHTTYLHYPGGQSLVYHVVDPLNGLISIPFQGIFGLLFTFNLLRLAQVVFSATAAYALCRVLGLPRPAAWVGGALYAICPIAATSFDLGQLVEISTGWIPLYILCLIRGLGNRALGLRPGRWGWLIAAALSLAASALATWYFFTALVLFTLLYALWEIVATWLRRKETITPDGTVSAGDPTPKQATEAANAPTRPVTSQLLFLIARAAGVGLGATLLLSPLLIALLKESASGDDYIITPLKTIIANSADLFSLFLPAPAHYNDLTVNPHGGTPALGWTVIALTAVALLFRKRHRRAGDRSLQYDRGHLYFWLAAASIFALLAMGPHLLIWGNDTGVPLPYQALSKVPFLGAARVPIRFMLVASLSMSVLAAYGLVTLHRLIRSQLARGATFAAIAVLIALEFVGVPRTLITPAVDPYFTTLAASGSEASNQAIMEIPAGVRAAPAMLAQTVHQHPILEAYTARHYPYPWFDATPGIAQLARSDANALSAPDIITPPVGDTALAALDYYGVRYVALYTTGNPALDGRARDAADTLFDTHNIQPLSEEGGLTIFKVPPQQPGGPFVGLGSGWYGVESSGERRWRWSDGNAMVQVTNPTMQVMPVLILLKAYTVNKPRTLIATLDEKELIRKEISAYPSQQIAVNIDLAPGEHWLALTSPEPAETPPGDSRRISLGFEAVSVERK